jgi:hypothetical protein
LTGARAAGYKGRVRVPLERIGIVAAMAVAALNIWTGAPLLACGSDRGSPAKAA